MSSQLELKQLAKEYLGELDVDDIRQHAKPNIEKEQSALCFRF